MNIFPSTQWLTFGKVLWGYCTFREKWVVVWSILIPVISQFVMVGAFGVAMRATMAAVRGELEGEWRLLLTAAIFAVFGLSSLLQWLKIELEIKKKEACHRVIRDLVAERYLRMRSLSNLERVAQNKEFKKPKVKILKKGATGLSNFIDMVSCLLITAALVLVMIVIFPSIGILVVLVGVGALAFLRKGTRPIESPPLEYRRELRSELSAIEMELMADRGKGSTPEELQSRYRDNLYDPKSQEATTIRKRKEGHIAGLVSLAAAVLITITFYVLSGEHHKKLDPVLMLIFVFALRISVSRGRLALSKWYGLLREKPFFIEMMRVSGQSVEKLVK